MTEHHQRAVSHNQSGDCTLINLGNVHGSINYHLPTPHQAARAEVVRVIPYPRNEDLVCRRDLIDRLDKLLPQTQGFHSAALWGLGGSGKTQIALDYGYRRCGNDEKCSVFWVHADNEASFTSDYKTIGRKLGVDEQLEGSDLLEEVCSKIGERSRWVMIVDNADNLGLFGVGTGPQRTAESLCRYVPHTSHGTVLWTSRDAHIAGTLVSAGRGIEVRSLEADEAMTLLTRTRNDESTAQEAGVTALLEELQRLPLAISQAGAYMPRTSMTASEYLSLLAQGRTRWEVLKMSDADRHRRPEVSNSVLETWRISIERIREESKMSYRMLHVIAGAASDNAPRGIFFSQYASETRRRAQL
ncbi:hypothetical protein N3K66_009100 [Trichothecium roseum]|uniref:Uncharacterized protein n=1 Tax=Trichothecium roseum TaxID=47278 RepID=A0ACC0UPP8_9HYPO|nr:hypothetical protein N3K66_009100 [Trichothecium roseum]